MFCASNTALKYFDKEYHYASPYLLFSPDCVQGFLYKRIEHEKVYHLDDFHKRFYRISFQEGTMLAFKDQKAG